MPARRAEAHRSTRRVRRSRSSAMTTMNSPPAAAAPRRQGAGPGRVVAIVAAVFLMLIGVLLAVGGTVLMATFGTDGEINSARPPVATPTAAVVTDIASVRDAS